MFPKLRLRGLRKDNLRPLFKETKLSKEDFIVPIFVDENIKKNKPINSMPGYYRVPVDGVVSEIETCLEKGLKAFILFGIPSYKDEVGSSAYDENGVIQKAVRRAKKSFLTL